MRDCTCHQTEVPSFSSRHLRSGSPPVPADREESVLYRSAGLKLEFVKRIVATPNDDIWIPSRYELLREDVLTR